MDGRPLLFCLDGNTGPRDGLERVLPAEDAYGWLQAAGVQAIVTSNSLAHASNALDLNGLIAAATAELLATTEGIS